MKRPDNLKIGDKFIVVVRSRRNGTLNKGDVVTLIFDDGSIVPQFELPNKQVNWIDFSRLEPYIEQPPKPSKPKRTIRLIRKYGGIPLKTKGGSMKNIGGRYLWKYRGEVVTVLKHLPNSYGLYEVQLEDSQFVMVVREDELESLHIQEKYDQLKIGDRIKHRNGDIWVVSTKTQNQEIWAYHESEAQNTTKGIYPFKYTEENFDMSYKEIKIGEKYHLIPLEQAEEHYLPNISKGMEPYFGGKGIIEIVSARPPRLLAKFPDGEEWFLNEKWLIPVKESKFLGENKPRIRKIRGR